MPTPIAFACDAMLGGLARWIRASGYDASWHHGIDDRELVRLAGEQGRTLLSSDTKIFDFAVIRGKKQPALFVPVDLRPREQLAFVFSNLGLPLLEPRCMACGGELSEKAREAVAGRVPSRTYAWLDRFWECNRCGKVFWHGTHWDSSRRRWLLLLWQTEGESCVISVAKFTSLGNNRSEFELQSWPTPRQSPSSAVQTRAGHRPVLL